MEHNLHPNYLTCTNVWPIMENLILLFQGYGIAMSLSTFKPLIDSAILHVQESGALHKLNVKWWKQKRGGGMLPFGYFNQGSIS